MGGPYSDTHDICPCFFNTHIPWVVSTMFYLDATCNLLAEMIQFDWCSFTLRKKPTRFRDMYHGQYVHIFLYLSLCIVQCRYVSQPCWIQSWFRYISAESIAHDQIIITLQVGKIRWERFRRERWMLVNFTYLQTTYRQTRWNIPRLLMEETSNHLGWIYPVVILW